MKKLAAILLLSTVIPAKADADVTYTYIGNDFTTTCFFGSPCGPSPFPYSLEHLVITLTLPDALPPSVSISVTPALNAANPHFQQYLFNVNGDTDLRPWLWKRRQLLIHNKCIRSNHRLVD